MRDKPIFNNACEACDVTSDRENCSQIKKVIKYTKYMQWY